MKKGFRKVQFLSIALIILIAASSFASDYIHKFQLDKRINKEDSKNFITYIKPGIFYNADLYWVLLEWGRMEGDKFIGGHDMLNSGEYWHTMGAHMHHVNTADGNWLYPTTTNEDKILLSLRDKMDDEFKNAIEEDTDLNSFIQILAWTRIDAKLLPSPYSDIAVKAPDKNNVLLTVDNYGIYRVFIIFRDDEYPSAFPDIFRWNKNGICIK